MTYERIFNERQEDLLTLCVDCHNRIHEIGDYVPLTEEEKGKYPLIGNNTNQDPPLKESFYNFFDGLLLAKGSILVQSNVSGLYRGFSNSKDYIDYLKEEFEKYGVELRFTKISGSDRGFDFRTLSYPFLLKQYDRWYKKGQKIIPKDITITPKGMLNFYLQNGTFDKSNSVRFCLGRYRVSDREYLKHKLETKFAWNISLHKNNNLYLYREDASEFFDYIDDCPDSLLSDYNYKFCNTDTLAV